MSPESARPALAGLEQLISAARVAGGAEGGAAEGGGDRALDEAVRIGAEAVGEIEFRLRRAGDELLFRGWFTPAASALASGGLGAGPEAPVRLMICATARLAQRLAGLAELGPRAGGSAPVQAPVDSATLDRLLAGEGAGEREVAEAALGGAGEGLGGWAEALADPDLTSWTVTRVGLGEHATALPRAGLEVLDAPSDRVWLVLDGAQETERLLVATEPRLVWAALVNLLP